jgi:Fe-S-cluster-containing dehydrogenase component
MLGQADTSSHDLVRAYWQAHVRGDFEGFWRQSLVHGVVPSGSTAPVDVHVDWPAIAHILAAPPTPEAPLEIAFFADPKVRDGRFGDNAWLQELPDPVTKLTWGNAALVGPATAKRLDIGDERVVTLQVRERTVRAPVLVVPGMADGVVALALGYGQAVPGRTSCGVGVDAYALRDSRTPWFDDATLHRTGDTKSLALTQEHGSMEDRPIVLWRTLDEYRRDPDFAKPLDERPSSLYELAPDAPHQWGMTIDLNACTGCSACVVACMAENNIPTVGEGGVRLGRAMHWLRIDRYYVGDPREPAAVVQPMLCQHCEKAPCEYVCPVNATVHSHDGLNEMIYNRCVGTRFCSNNCPYKVRRFNFFNYNAGKPETLALLMNPDVTVRARGVMEKCTYCVQRIREAEIVARREQRPIADGEIVTACQQTCPTDAITFGDIADPKTRVSKARENNRLYQVLHDLGTVPRTRYLARIVNPNPDLGPA